MPITVSKRVSGYLTGFINDIKAELPEPKEEEFPLSIFVGLDLEHIEQAIHEIFRDARDSRTNVNWAKIAAICANGYASDKEAANKEKDEE